MKIRTESNYPCHVLFLALLLLLYQNCLERKSDLNPRFHYYCIDKNPPPSPWGKTTGDINGDGLLDLIVAGHSPPKPNIFKRIAGTLKIIKYQWPVRSELVWYQNPNWKKHVVSSNYNFRTDLEVADIDSDGKEDIVALTDKGIFWFKNPDWLSEQIDSIQQHDIEIVDLDKDGDYDIITRNQRLFSNSETGDKIHIYRHDGNVFRGYFSVDVPRGEGLQIEDLNKDGYPDIIVNNYWFKNPGKISKTDSWKPFQYSSSWNWPDVFIDVSDINRDGLPDIILSPAEPAGKTYRISWFESPRSIGDMWVEHVIDPEVESVHHFIQGGDFDNDGDMDILSSEMREGIPPHEVKIYWRNNDTLWQKQVVYKQGSHSMRVFDVDLDGDLDFFGANWNGDGKSTVDLWINQTKTNDPWKRHSIDTHKPWRSLFIRVADIDLDGFPDIVSGGWWYTNPGNPEGVWHRKSIGYPANNAVYIDDFDKDGDLDIFASQWNEPREWSLYEKLLRKLHLRSYSKKGSFAWARNDGKGQFETFENIELGHGDFLQGIVKLQIGTRIALALAWHGKEYQTEAVFIPDDPVGEQWQCEVVSKLSQNEQLNSADFDQDEDSDLLLGTKWLRNEGNGEFREIVMDSVDLLPDRNVIVDIDGDGLLDVVVGFEAINTSGPVFWYRNNGDSPGNWDKSLITRVIGPMSLDACDMDEDGDTDIVIGEHNLAEPENAKLLLFENMEGKGKAWRGRVLSTGDEHHNGVIAVDMDHDGDKDIISIGWGHDQVLLYENPLYTKKTKEEKVRIDSN